MLASITVATRLGSGRGSKAIRSMLARALRNSETRFQRPMWIAFKGECGSPPELPRTKSSAPSLLPKIGRICPNPGRPRVSKSCLVSLRRPSLQMSQ